MLLKQGIKIGRHGTGHIFTQISAMGSWAVGIIQTTCIISRCKGLSNFGKEIIPYQRIL